ncbi:hypothetical protein TNCT_563131 [Trichonephila clavata]|uniref:Uncharacterized protein n=1 Tax=Trichonephila clavata TaxID=2740835 RepID=A0A8X6LBP5_TRICU|nr:hypothetical protein TNCT_563131 [Trichonephila clavata]
MLGKNAICALLNWKTEYCNGLLYHRGSAHDQSQQNWAFITKLCERYCVWRLCPLFTCRGFNSLPMATTSYWLAVFARWMIETIQKDPRFPATILFTNEYCFTSVDDMPNAHMESSVNPHVSVMSKVQHEFSVNIWAENL